MKFLWPEMLWLLLAIPALVWLYLFLLRRGRRGTVRYASLGLVKEALGPGQRVRRHVPPALFLVALAASLLAIARPSAMVTLPSQEQTLIMAMDVSLSMRATDVDPSRITAAQTAAKGFLEGLPPKLKVGIVAFGGSAALVQPPTHDREELVNAVERFQLQRGTATGSALLVSLNTLLPDSGIDVESAIFGSGWGGGYGGGGGRNAERAEKKRSPLDRGAKADAPKQEFVPVPPGSYQNGAIVLLSDGRRTTGPDPLDAAKMAADRGVRVYTVGFGTPEGASIGFGGWSIYVRLDEETLKAIAEITKGEYFYAGTADDLKKVYERLSSRVILEKKETEITALVTAGAALLMLLAAGLSVLWFNRGT